MIAVFDIFRSKFLKESLKISFLRTLFHSRADRVLILFLTAAFTYFLASSFFPLWILLVGPILWGVPHLISSLRYSVLGFRENTRSRLLLFQFFIWALVLSYRLSVDVLHQPLFLSAYPLLLETLLLMVSFFYQIYLFQNKNLQHFYSFLLFAGLIASTYYFPLQTALVALIGHNYLPLIAWFKSCQSRADLRTFWISTAVFITLSVLIYTGTFDPVYSFYAPLGRIEFLKWDYSEVISPFVLGAFDYQFWFHIVVLYAFSQSMHYFIWLKAIPENYHNKQYPPSFQWSVKKLTSDLGLASLYLFIFLLCVGLGIWIFFEFQTARLVYFSIASYHGFMEISAIPFLQSNRKE